MPSTRFDPDEGKPYGKCLTCGIDLATDADAKAHRTETAEAAHAAGKNGGHGTRTLNAPRAERIENEVDSLVQDAYESFVEELQKLVNGRHITEAEATTAVFHFDGFDEAWRKSLED